jgi:glycerol-3-phosphate dehydrogenase (NAD(P)+)
MTTMRETVAIVGGGAWGTALAISLGRRGDAVRLWMYEDDLVRRMLERRDNPVFLPGIQVPETVLPTTDLAAAVDSAAIVVFVVPTPFARGVYERLEPHLAADPIVVIATKGIEEDTLLLPTEVAAECLGGAVRTTAMSGPSFADEVARGVPTAVVVAARDAALARGVQERLACEGLRLYTNTDPVGVQIAAALKNVVAIAAGIADGLGFGHNTVAALITRGLAEIRRLGVARGASPETFSGLASLGDLVLTCTGSLSRNRQVGQALGRGERLADIVARTPHVAEGVRTARSARSLALRAGVEMPIVEEVYCILYEDRAPREAVTRLMSRPLAAEDGPSEESAP